MHFRRLVFTTMALCLAIRSLAGPTDRKILLPTVSAMAASKAGVDSNDNLWFWNASSNSVTLISAAGDTLTAVNLPSANSVDADAQRGIAVLTSGGDQVEVLGWHGTAQFSLHLPEPAGDIAWLDGFQVLVTPYFMDHTAAVWDVATGHLVRTIGNVLPIAHGAGRHLARATLVRYNATRGEIALLDATFGNLLIYDIAGVLVGHGRVPGPSTPVQQWLSVDNVESSAARYIVVWRYPAITIDHEGFVWISVASEASTATLYRFSLTGVAQTIRITGPRCLRANAVIWHDLLILHGNDRANSEGCTAIVDTTTIDYGAANATGTAVAVQIGPAYISNRIPGFAVIPNATPPCQIQTTDHRATQPCSCSDWSCPMLDGWILVGACSEDPAGCKWACVYTKDC